ncbi:MAG: thioredoxin-disulfide reductase [Bdellovibrionota bacterium]|jgi:thioredoxin reductase (NADPH)
MEKHAKTIILGSGPAGLTAAIYAARGRLKPLLFEGPQIGGQLAATSEIENFPGFPDGISGYDLSELFKKQALKFGTEIVSDTVTAVDLLTHPFTIRTTTDTTFSCDSLIIACGSGKRLWGIAGETELFGYGVSTCATCDGAFFKDVPVAVIGGGNSACKEALFLTRFASKVFIINQSDSFEALPDTLHSINENSKIEPIFETRVTKINGTKAAGVTSIEVVNDKLKSTKTLECAAVFIASGYKPNSELFINQLELDEKGYIITKPDSTATNIDGVFACGDIRLANLHQVATAVGSGCLAALEVEKWLKH